MSDQISISAAGDTGVFQAFIALPTAVPRGAVVVIQEIFGINGGIRAKCDALAAAGYLAVAPDLFWRLQPGVDLDPDDPSQFAAALELMNRFDQDSGVSDIAATIGHIRALLPGGKIAAVGYCLGGRLAFMTACRTDIDASICYYGVGIDGLLGEAAGIAAPVLLHIPTSDGFVPPAAQAAIHAGLDVHPKVVLHDYPGLDHGFATQFGKRRDDAGAVLADQRTMAFLAEHIDRSAIAAKR